MRILRVTFIIEMVVGVLIGLHASGSTADAASPCDFLTEPDEKPGLGVIVPNSMENRLEFGGYMIFPSTHVPVYGKDQQRCLGCLKIDRDNPFFVIISHCSRTRTCSCDKQLCEDSPDKTGIRAFQKDIVEIEEEAFALMYVEEKGDFVRILSRSFENPEVWISRADLAAIGFRAAGWVDFLASVGDRSFYPCNPSIDIYGKPGMGERRVAACSMESIQTKTLSIKPTGQTFEEWLQVEMVFYDVQVRYDNSRLDYTRLKEWKKEVGWVKVPDARGAPLLWYYTRD